MKLFLFGGVQNGSSIYTHRRKIKNEKGVGNGMAVKYYELVNEYYYY